ncbi:cryptochrome DASH, chloroplastic/mitochondrial isoform X2 [Euphorbia lathyris]|uniref:cryptochrome DASH, chloroplastic/mitochondrial isoform X2 n=1 Tax=Euphorbia lathyris TaxID=212925 RepID=UPI0033140D7D
MNYSSSRSFSSSSSAVPGTDPDEIDEIAVRTFDVYSSNTVKKKGNKGISIVWFRNDLRILDNEALLKAWVSSDSILPVYCVDPRLFHTTFHFGFPKTGALRAQFIMECLADLKKNLMKRGLNLLIRHGLPEQILPSLAKSFTAHTVYAQMETCSEELNVERLVSKALNQGSSNSPKLQLVWGSTMYHIDDLPFDTSSLPDVYTQFRKSVEAKCSIRRCVKIPKSLAPSPSVEDWGSVPTMDQLRLEPQKVDKGMKFLGGETAALNRVHEYFWKKVKRYEKERQANDSTYWVLFELIWRDYFRFLSIKCGNSLFRLGGPRNVKQTWSQDPKLFESWRDGTTGYPLIDANMKELSTTGFMSNRGRQIVCSFLVRDMGIDWRMGAEWFETCLLDYDPCSNYGNWTYGAGVGNDPREDRYFSIPKQAQNYDSEGEYVAYWLPELKRLQKDMRHFPGKLYIDQVVPLKFGNPNKFQGKASSSVRPTKGFRR